jgi:hypothetical protein
MSYKIYLIIPFLALLLICPAYAQELEGDGEMLIREDTQEEKPELDIEFLFCQDESCSTEKTEFSLNDKFYINYLSDIKLPVSAQIQAESGELVASINLPAFYSFTAPGNFVVSFSTSIDAYREITYKKVITIDAIKDESGICRVDTQCINGETSENCPLDCLGDKDSKNGIYEKYIKNNYKKIFLLVAFILLADIFYFAVIKKRLNKKDEIQKI